MCNTLWQNAKCLYSLYRLCVSSLHSEKRDKTHRSLQQINKSHLLIMIWIIFILWASSYQFISCFPQSMHNEGVCFCMVSGSNTLNSHCCGLHHGMKQLDIHVSGSTATVQGGKNANPCCLSSGDTYKKEWGGINKPWHLGIDRFEGCSMWKRKKCSRQGEICVVLWRGCLVQRSCHVHTHSEPIRVVWLCCIQSSLQMG